MVNFEIEKSYTGPVIGLDEVGRGPLAGPVISCGCMFADYDYLQDKLNFDEVKDLAHQPIMNQMHLRTELGNPQKNDLLILDLGDQILFEKSCLDKGISLDLISEFKEQVHEGFKSVIKSNPNYKPYNPKPSTLNPQPACVYRWMLLRKRMMLCTMATA